MAADQLPMKTVGQLYDMMYKDALTKKALGQTPEKVSALDQARTREIDEKIIQMGKVVKPSALDQARTDKLIKETGLLGVTSELDKAKLELSGLNKSLAIFKTKYAIADSLRDKALASKQMANAETQSKLLELRIKELESKDDKGIDPKMIMTLGNLEAQMLEAEEPQMKIALADQYNRLLPDEATVGYGINRNWEVSWGRDEDAVARIQLPFDNAGNQITMGQIRAIAKKLQKTPEEILWEIYETENSLDSSGSFEEVSPEFIS